MYPIELPTSTVQSQGVHWLVTTLDLDKKLLYIWPIH